MVNNDLQHLDSDNTMTLAINNTIGGFRGPIPVKRALRDYPEEFKALLDEMSRAMREAETKQMELGL